MAIVTTNNQHYYNIANALRAKGVVGSLKPQEMAEAIAGISSVSDTEITDGIAVTSRDANGYATAIDYYGTTVHPYMFGNNGSSSLYFIWRNLQTITFKTAVTVFGEHAFDRTNSNFQITVPDTVTQIGNQCFAYSQSVSDIVIPQSVGAIGLSAFYSSKITGYADTYMNAQASYGGEASNPQILYSCTNLNTVQFGSEGHPVTQLNRYVLSRCTQSNLTVIAYCCGDYADSLLGNLRNGATNAAIILKAAESTAYNGRAFSAGETMVTSEVSV